MDNQSTSKDRKYSRRGIITGGLLGIASAAGCYEVSQNTESPSPEASDSTFVIENLAPVTHPIEQGDTLTVTATVTNTADTQKTQRVEFRINGEILTDQKLTLGPGDKKRVTFDIPDTTDFEQAWHTFAVFSADHGQTGSLLIQSSNPFEKLLFRYEWKRVTGEGLVDYNNPRIQEVVTQWDEVVETRLEELIKNPNDRLWPGYPLGRNNEDTDAPHRDLQTSYYNIVTLAKAYATPISDFYDDQEVLEAIRHSFEFLAEYYNQNQDTYGNWWEWAIGIPSYILPVLLLVEEDLPQSLVDRYTAALQKHTYKPKISQGVGDLLLMANLRVKLGIVKRDETIIEDTLRTIPPALKYRGQGGFFRDGSAIFHHQYPLTMGYGENFLSKMTSLTTFLEGSPWSVTRQEFPGNIDFLYEVAFEGFEPLMWRGQAMSMVAGRKQQADYEAIKGQSVTQAFIRLGELDESKHSRRFKGTAKAWIEQNNYESYLENQSSIPAYARAANLIEDNSISARKPLVLTKQYFNMDRAVYRNENVAFGLAMFSDRIGNYEVVGESRGPTRGWFTSYGMTYLYTDDLAHYNDGYWHTIDPKHIAGTTINPAITDKIQPNTRGTSPHAGGVTFDDRSGSSGMKLVSVVDPDLLQAHKSWFYFGDILVAVGSGITGDALDTQITTTVTNRNLGSEDMGTFTVDSEEIAPEAPADVELQSVNWAHLDRETESIGYVFPTEPTVYTVREANNPSAPNTGTRDATGPYTGQATDEPYTNYFAKLLLKHGSTPEAAEYSYTVIPGADKDTTVSVATNPPFEVLVRTPSIHVVKHIDRSLTGIQAFAKTSLDEPHIEVDGPASVIWQENKDEVIVTIADPTQQRNAIEVQLPVIVTENIAIDPRMKVIQQNPLRIRVATNELPDQKRGATLKATFSR